MEGYAKVASLMGTYPEFSMLRRFRALNMQNLLYLQAEITHLEVELRRLAQEDLASGKKPDRVHDWWTLARDDEFGDPKQWELILEIRGKLEKYSTQRDILFTSETQIVDLQVDDTLLKYTTIVGFPGPSKPEVKFLRNWLERPSMGSLPLYGLDQSSWDKEHERDLLALSSRATGDPFSRWFANKAIPIFHHVVGKRFKEPVSDGVYDYNDSTIVCIGNVLSTVVASMLPLGSIVILYFVTSNGLRLTIIAILSACFSLALAVLTTARKIEIFAATSAFAAVNVVYLTNGLPSTPL